MCDYSLQNVKSRSAKVGDKLATRNFGTGTRGFAAPEDATTAVCVLPGTELAFSRTTLDQFCQWRSGPREKAKDGAHALVVQNSRSRSMRTCGGLPAISTALTAPIEDAASQPGR
jgi:hypothetical protein